MKLIFMLIPVALILCSVFCAVKAMRGGTKAKKALLLQMLSFVFIATVTMALPSVLSAAEEKDTTPETVQTSETSASSSSSGLKAGLGLLAASAAVGFAAIGGGRAVAASAPAAIAATSEDPKAFGKALIFVALGEGIALYGLLISILILNKI